LSEQIHIHKRVKRVNKESSEQRNTNISSSGSDIMVTNSEFEDSMDHDDDGQHQLNESSIDKNSDKQANYDTTRSSSPYDLSVAYNDLQQSSDGNNTSPEQLTSQHNLHEKIPAQEVNSEVNSDLNLKFVGFNSMDKNSLLLNEMRINLTEIIESSRRANAAALHVVDDDHDYTSISAAFDTKIRRIKHALLARACIDSILTTLLEDT